MYHIPGKPITVSTAGLDLEISAGIILGFTTWIPAKNHADYFGTSLPCYYDRIELQVKLDNTVLFSGAVGKDTVKIHHDFDDSQTHCQHTLDISVSGFDPEFNQLFDEKEAFHMVRIDNIAIENLHMQYVLENLGEYHHDGKTEIPSKYLGFNGQCKLEFETPIYKWLLSNDHLIKPIADSINTFNS